MHENIVYVNIWKLLNLNNDSISISQIQVNNWVYHNPFLTHNWGDGQLYESSKTLFCRTKLNFCITIMSVFVFFFKGTRKGEGTVYLNWKYKQHTQLQPGSLYKFYKKTLHIKENYFLPTIRCTTRFIWQICTQITNEKHEYQETIELS